MNRKSLHKRAVDELMQSRDQKMQPAIIIRLQNIFIPMVAVGQITGAR